MVVPHAGTWIEMLTTSCPVLTSSSFPTRERGLKFASGWIASSHMSVVPHAGTWIEISLPDTYRLNQPSFPTRERGLKYDVQLADIKVDSVKSFPTRERGLKSQWTYLPYFIFLSFPTRERGLK